MATKQSDGSTRKKLSGEAKTGKPQALSLDGDGLASLEAKFGKEILRPGATVTVPAGAQVRFLFHFFSTPGLMVVRLHQVGEMVAETPALMSQTVPPPQPVDLRQKLQSGTWILRWAFRPLASPWQTAVEIAVDEIVRFRHFKTDESELPFPTGDIILEVI